jgi:DNA-directed RNA polymerase specialized sigma24 family protein
LYESGMSLREVSELTGVPKGTVRHRLLLCGVEMRSRGGNQLPVLSYDEMRKTIFLYRDYGLSTYEVGEVLGLTHSTVQFRLARAGIQIRDKGISCRMRFSRRPRGS